MTNDRLETLRKLNEARTKGPWTNTARGSVYYDGEDDEILVCQCYHPDNWGGKPTENAAFIAALANNADWLIECVEALQWYADKENHEYGPDDSGRVDMKTYIELDKGKRAAAALADGQEK